MTFRRMTFLSVVLLIGQAAQAADRPNIVYFMADDLGIGDVQCFGGERCKIDTPNFDALAAQGMRFTDAHALAAVCVPTRVGVMTGRYPWRFARPRPDGPWGFLNPRLSTDQFTLGRLLQSADYRTGYVGKWHLGTLMTTRDGENQNPTNVDYTRPLKIGPNDYGFDFSFILPGSLDMYPYAFVRDGKWVGSVTAQKGWSAFNRVGPAAEDFEDYKVLGAFSNQAEEFIERNAKQSRDGKPFFLYVATTAPHTPISPSPAFVGKSKLGLYGDFVMETDDVLGRVLRALKRQGLAENTLVIATSDHGAASYAGNIRKAIPGNVHNLEKLGHYPSGIYRGYKFSVYEGGHRVPFVVRWPGVVEAGSRCDRVIGLVDLMGTLAQVTDADVSERDAPDSIGFLRLLKDGRAEAARPDLVMQSIGPFVVRMGKWKLAICPGSGATGTYGNTPGMETAWRDALKRFGRKPTREELRGAPFVQLFDIAEDPTESKNLAAEHPDVVRRLFAILDSQIAAGRSRPGPKLQNDVPRVNYFARVPKFVLGQQ